MKPINNNDSALALVEQTNYLQTSEIEKFLDKHYDFRYNVVLSRIEYKKKSADTYELMNDYIENSICRSSKRSGIKVSTNTLREILLSDFTRTFDPFVEYLNSLPKWDQQTDFIGQLAATVSTTNDKIWNTFLKKWIVAMVASLMKADEVNHTVLVFYGAQGKGKTTWIENLIPAELKSYLFTGTINPNDKDAIIHLAERMLINLDELESLNRSEIGSLKSLITQKNITIRRPYGRNSENLIRRASFAGSINTSQFLNDSTGSRRFLVIEVTDIAYQHTVSINMVLSQALSLFKSGFQYWFDQAEQQMINENNAKYQRVSLEEESLLDKFAPADQNDPEAIYLTTTEIANSLKEGYGVRTDASALNLLGKALSKYGFLRLKKQNAYRYCLKNIKSSSKNAQLQTQTMQVA